MKLLVIISYLVNNIANLKESPQAIIATKEPENFKRPMAEVNSGAITPAENQATAKLVKNSEYTFCSPANSAINKYSTIRKLTGVKNGGLKLFMLHC